MLCVAGQLDSPEGSWQLSGSNSHNVRVISAECLPWSFRGLCSSWSLLFLIFAPVMWSPVSDRLWMQVWWRWPHLLLVRWGWFNSPGKRPIYWLRCHYSHHPRRGGVCDVFGWFRRTPSLCLSLVPAIPSSSSSGPTPSSVFFLSQLYSRSLVLWFP